jgi:hypothetical protein
VKPWRKQLGFWILQLWMIGWYASAIALPWLLGRPVSWDARLSVALLALVPIMLWAAIKGPNKREMWLTLIVFTALPLSSLVGSWIAVVASFVCLACRYGPRLWMQPVHPGFAGLSAGEGGDSSTAGT